MTDAQCHYCENVTEVWACYRCDQLTCEDCFTPMSHMATDPVTDCLECSCESERRACKAADRERGRQKAERERKDAANRAAHARYWRPENVTKRRVASAERKRLKAEANLKNLVESLRIVSGWLS